MAQPTHSWKNLEGGEFLMVGLFAAGNAWLGSKRLLYSRIVAGSFAAMNHAFSGNDGTKSVNDLKMGYLIASSALLGATLPELIKGVRLLKVSPSNLWGYSNLGLGAAELAWGGYNLYQMGYERRPNLLAPFDDGPEKAWGPVDRLVKQTEDFGKRLNVLEETRNVTVKEAKHFSVRLADLVEKAKAFRPTYKIEEEEGKPTLYQDDKIKGSDQKKVLAKLWPALVPAGNDMYKLNGNGKLLFGPIPYEDCMDSVWYQRSGGKAPNLLHIARHFNTTFFSVAKALPGEEHGLLQDANTWQAIEKLDSDLRAFAASVRQDLKSDYNSKLPADKKQRELFLKEVEGRKKWQNLKQEIDQIKSIGSLNDETKKARMRPIQKQMQKLLPVSQKQEVLGAIALADKIRQCRTDRGLVTSYETLEDLVGTMSTWQINKG